MGEFEFDVAVNGEYVTAPQEASASFVPAFLANTKGFTFDREEDYERLINLLC